MLSYIKNMDIMLVSNHFEREESELSNSVRRPESPKYNALVDNESNSNSNSRENEIRVLLVMAITQEEPNLVVNLIGYR